MATKVDTEAVLALAQRVKHWPTVSELADVHGVPGRLLRRAISHGELEAFRLNVLRVNPESFAAWLAARQKK